MILKKNVFFSSIYLKWHFKVFRLKRQCTITPSTSKKKKNQSHYRSERHMSCLMSHRNHHDVLNYHANDANDARECRLMRSWGSMPDECMCGWMINSVSCMTGHTRQRRIVTFILVSPHKRAIFEAFCGVWLQLAQIIGFQSVSEASFCHLLASLPRLYLNPTLIKSYEEKNSYQESSFIKNFCLFYIFNYLWTFFVCDSCSLPLIKARQPVVS